MAVTWCGWRVRERVCALGEQSALVHHPPGKPTGERDPRASIMQIILWAPRVIFAHKLDVVFDGNVGFLLIRWKEDLSTDVCLCIYLHITRQDRQVSTTQQSMDYALLCVYANQFKTYHKPFLYRYDRIWCTAKRTHKTRCELNALNTLRVVYFYLRACVWV